MTIMCEFDTLSETNEVFHDIWEVIEQSFIQINDAREKNQVSATDYLYLLRVIINDMRGLFEGIYRER